MPITTQALREWLERNYHDCSIEPDPVYGTYGQIWFLTTKSAYPAKKFAVKTVTPEKLTQGLTVDDVKFLRREFRMWLGLPETYNVLPALGFDFAHLSDGIIAIDLPVMRMPRMNGSLQEWVSKPSPGQVVDRLLALSQALNGLQYLYDHGFQGHGDLKPSNLLYDDLRTKTSLMDGMTWPSTIHPWRIRIADLGWADAWVDLGYSNKVDRQYMAPERMGGTVVPIKSDMFSMGVIASELLQGQHPAGDLKNLKKVRQSEGKWRRWIDSKERFLGEIQSPRLHRIIERCLDPMPDSRPSATEFLEELCTELKCGYSIDVVQTLILWRSRIFGDNIVAKHDYEAWAAVQSLRLGELEKQTSLQQIAKKMEQINVHDFESCEAWAPLAEAFVQLSDNSEEQDCIRKIALHYLVTILGPFSGSAIRQLGRRSDLPSLREYERFSQLVGDLARIGEFRTKNNLELLQKLGSTAGAALYFYLSSELRMEEGNRKAIEMLSYAISKAPDEAVHYYFRARWRNEIGLIDAITHSQAASNIGQIAEVLKTAVNEQIIQDLETAIKLAPDWEEPRQLLGSFRKKRSA
jgi:serine/threonine protein kinase